MTNEHPSIDRLTINVDCKKEYSLLETLDLSKCNLKSIEIDDLPSKFENLKYLNMSNSSISNLDPSFYLKTPKLEVLLLVESRLTSEVVFKNLPNLKRLDLSLNKLVKLRENLFENLPDLHVLDLSNCETVISEPNLFSNMKKLTCLNLERNRIESDLIFFSAGLKSLNMKECDLERIGDSSFLKKLTELSILILSKNKLKNLSQDMFHSMKNLKYLDLSQNSFTRLHPEQFISLSNLEVLDLSQNSFTRLHPEQFISLSNLEVLDLSENKLDMLHSEQFKCLKKLEKLKLSLNKLK
jgi:leucine-rich repeat-containing G protein-coupled receptor 8